MTSLPSVALQFAVWLLVTVMPQSAIFSRKPLPRSMAARGTDVADELDDVLLGAALEQLAHLDGGLAALLDEVGADVGRVEVLGSASMRRSSRTTVLPAALASCRTCSQPAASSAARMMTFDRPCRR